MDTRNSFIEAIGNSPMIRLQAASEETGCDILGKAEFLNPGGSVKDRAAWGMIREAERAGLLQAGSIVVEATAGNTGIALAHICNARDYRCVIYMPDNQSPQKVDILETLGAEVRVVATLPYHDDMNYQKQAGRYAASTPGALWLNQFDNPANQQAHYETTGAEIWQQSGGNVDAFVCAVGTGGTIAGVSQYLKQQNPATQVVLVDCMGSALYSYVSSGLVELSEGPTITEGIGNSRVTANLANAGIDWALQVSDQEMVGMLQRLLREEGWFFGSSSGINVCGAIAVAKQLGPGHCIVTMLCDGGAKYQSRLYNPAWLAEKGLSI